MTGGHEPTWIKWLWKEDPEPSFWMAFEPPVQWHYIWPPALTLMCVRFTLAFCHRSLYYGMALLEVVVVFRLAFVNTSQHKHQTISLLKLKVTFVSWEVLILWENGCCWSIDLALVFILSAIHIHIYISICINYSILRWRTKFCLLFCKNKKVWTRK